MEGVLSCDRLPTCENDQMLVESGFQFGVFRCKIF
jgi:hypothetical protein